MGNKVPQPTVVLVKRLRRVAKFLDQLAHDDAARERHRAHANTCWQAAARLEDLSRASPQPGAESA